MLRGQTNSQILRNLHFSNPFTTLFDKPSSARFPLRLYYSESLERLYESSRAVNMVDGLPRAPSEDISESVNSFDRGAIFPPRSGHDLSRNGFVVSRYSF